jgi:hypothetical protein
VSLPRPGEVALLTAIDAVNGCLPMTLTRGLWRGWLEYSVLPECSVVQILAP